MALDPHEDTRATGHGTKPPNAAEIEAALEQARAMLDWPDNWDGEGSMAYSEAVWRRASDFLTDATRQLWARHQRTIPVPDIEPGPQGSIDFHWQVDGREMLLNLPAEPAEMVDFYGDTSAGESVKGRAHTSTVGPWLLAWLTN